MSPSRAFADLLLQWLDILDWTAQAADVASCVAFDGGLYEPWDDLRWDAIHDRDALRTQLTSWTVDESLPSSSRTELAAGWEKVAVELDEEAMPTKQVQQRADAALHWLRVERLRHEALVMEAAPKETPAIQHMFATVLQEMCLTPESGRVML